MRQSFPIFELEFSYEDIYNVDVDKSLAEGTQIVWHAIKFLNNSQYALTTAPVMITNIDNVFMSQDILKYSNYGSLCTVKMSKTNDIKCVYELTKTDKKEESIGWFTKISINSKKCKIEISNNKNEKVKILLTQNIKGILISSIPEIKRSKIL